VSVISKIFRSNRQFAIPPKNLKLCNGKLAVGAKNLSISMWEGD